MCLTSCAENEIRPGKYFSGSFSVTFDYTVGKDTLSGIADRTDDGKYTIMFYYPDTVKNLKMTYYLGGITITYGEIRYDAESSLCEKAVITVFSEVCENIITCDSRQGKIRNTGYTVHLSDTAPTGIDLADGRRFCFRDYVKNK